MAFNKAKALLDAQKHVSEGKISQAIKQYLQIVEKDPTDLILLNTVGDLYIREKKHSEGMKQFYRLAEAYTKDGFIVKAIAIYRKISKLEPDSVEPMLKLGDLYSTQGLNRESREQYSSALNLLQKKKENDKAKAVVRKIAQLDPGNPQGQLQLAEFAERTGDKKEAANAYLEAATLADRMEDESTAEKALAKVIALQPDNPQVQLLRARQAGRKKDFAEVEKILTSAPQLSEDAAARRLLFDAYVALGKPDAADKLLLPIFHSNPTDFSPVASFASHCLAKQDAEAAFKAVSSVADEVIAQKDTEPLMETLRKIWSAAPDHLPTLELIYSVAEKSADEATIPEVLEALGHAYVNKGDLPKAESAFQKLVKREPENEDYRGLLRQVLQKEGKDYVPADAGELSAANAALEAPSESETAESPEEAAMVKEAVDNSDLFVRYNLTEKAVAELEKVLQVYPNQITVHRTLFEICRKNMPERSAKAGEDLARIYSARGDEANARRYRKGGGQPAEAAAPAEPKTPHVAEPAAGEPASAAPAAEFDLSQEFGFSEAKEAAPPGPEEIPLDLAPQPAQEGEAQFEPAEGAAPEREVEVLPFNFEESAEEIKFYLSQGLTDEARKAVEGLEKDHPENKEVAQLRKLLESPTPPAPAAEAPPEAPRNEEKAPVKEEPAAEGQADQGWELPASFAAPSPAQPPAAEVGAPAESANPLGGLADDLAEGLEGIQAPPGKAGKPAAPSGADLSGLLDELGETGPAEAAGDDPETHYNLGVAFHEMGLLDEAIGEFQKVAKVADKGAFPPNFLQACTLLAACFTEKAMPAIAAKWYIRALETPNLDGEATLALQYDLGASYEQAGDTKLALERFTEVYSQNIDYRDVAEKIRLLQLKTS